MFVSYVYPFLSLSLYMSLSCWICILFSLSLTFLTKSESSVQTELSVAYSIFFCLTLEKTIFSSFSSFILSTVSLPITVCNNFFHSLVSLSLSPLILSCILLKLSNCMLMTKWWRWLVSLVCRRETTTSVTGKGFLFLLASFTGLYFHVMIWPIIDKNEIPFPYSQMISVVLISFSFSWEAYFVVQFMLFIIHPLLRFCLSIILPLRHVTEGEKVVDNSILVLHTKQHQQTTILLIEKQEKEKIVRKVIYIRRPV